MKKYTFENTLISKKQLKQILAWSFTKYGSIKACYLADKLKNLGFKYASQAGISISIEDLRVPEIKNDILRSAQQEILNTEKICLKGKITEVERYQKIIDTWNITSELLKGEVVNYFKTYDPLNSVFIMAFSGARGNLSQVRQLVGMRGLMSDPSGQIMNLPIKKNFREGLTITDYLMSGYGARKGIVDTALKTANSGYLTRRLIDVAQDIIIREKDCQTTHSLLFTLTKNGSQFAIDKITGHLINKPIYDLKTNKLIIEKNTQITSELIRILKQYNVENVYIRSPLTCNLYRSICQKCYGWDLCNENLVDMGEAIGILAGQSIGEPGTQLTMRTFHTGGIFTSEANQQLISSIDGTINFSNLLKTTPLRTNRGENVLFTENSASLSIIPHDENEKTIQIELPRNTLLFVNNFQQIKKEVLIGQLAGPIKQVRTETKQIISNISGEVVIPKITSNISSMTQNKILWVLAGKVYQAPINSFLNYHLDYKISKNSFIFRSKIINYRPGLIKNQLKNGFDILNHGLICIGPALQKLSFPISNYNYLLTLRNSKYLLNFKSQDLKIQLDKLDNKNFAKLMSKNFLTLTGGIPYYNSKTQKNKYTNFKKSVLYISHIEKLHYRTLIWLSEEIHRIDHNTDLFLTENYDFISKHSEIIPNIFSRTSGIIDIRRKKTLTQEISIKSGFLQKITKKDKIKNLHKQIFFPGEILLNSIEISELSLCEVIRIDKSIQLLIRPIKLYEIPIPKLLKNSSKKCSSIFNLNNNLVHCYSSGKKIKESCPIEIVKQSIDLKLKNFVEKINYPKFEIFKNQLNQALNFSFIEKFQLNKYIPPDLKYVNLQSCLIIEKNQFIDSYTVIGFLESVTKNSLNLINLKSKRKNNKQLFLISNSDCITIKKDTVKNKIVDNFIIKSTNLNEIGKILISSNDYLTVQKGQPYFFPNCNNNNFINNNNLKYKLIDSNSLQFDLFQKKYIHFTYSNITSKFSEIIILQEHYEELFFPKLLMKKRGKYFSSGIPLLIREVLINKKNNLSTKLSNINKRPWHGYFDYKDNIYKTKRHNVLSYLNRIRLKNGFLMFMKNSQLIQNDIRNDLDRRGELASVIFLEHPFKSVAIHSLTEDYFEKEVNHVYCKNGEFIETNQTIGLLNFEKEITGDIVQGLPRVEELLEARKRQRMSRHIPKNQKKSLLIRKTTIDPSFEFRKLGTTIKENEKINPHNLLKVYFNYFARIKHLITQSGMKIKLCRLSDNYEASYKSFKKIQSLILNSVQLVYQSQGVLIANKHLEVIIKQMTTKVLITHEGNTPLLPREVIDLYHIQYINKIIQNRQKCPASYVPLLLGITKASLNNPSFISAASFQETTKVLTKAAIEGRLDWLRGLKENIVIGHLIPSGTGHKNYVKSFKKNVNRFLKSKSKNNLTIAFF